MRSRGTKILGLWAAAFHAASLGAAPPQKGVGVPPKNYVELTSSVNGGVFVDKAIKDEYDAAIGRLEALKGQLAKGEIDEKAALAAIASLRAELLQLDKRIEETKQHVAAFSLKEEVGTIDFPLGPEKTVLIVASHVRLVGWDKPDVRCEIHKQVLGVGDEPADKELAAMQVVHELRAADEWVGKSAARFRKEVYEGKPLTPVQEEFLKEYVLGYARLAPLQDKTIDVVTLKGISWQEGNAQVTMELRGDAHQSVASRWRRHASVTVFLPSCKLATVLGGRGALDVKGVQGSLTIVGDGDVDYDGAFSIDGVRGAVQVFDVPVQSLVNVHGDLFVQSTQLLENSGTTHEGDYRLAFPGRPRAYHYANIDGELRARLLRGTLRVENVGGRIDVSNEFGDTNLELTRPLAKAAHRVVSASGRISVKASRAMLAGAPFSAMSECGFVKVFEASPRALEESHFTLAVGQLGVPRTWRGFADMEKGRPGFELSDRMVKTFTGRSTEPAFDVLSRAGAVRVELNAPQP